MYNVKQIVIFIYEIIILAFSNNVIGLSDWQRMLEPVGAVGAECEVNRYENRLSAAMVEVKTSEYSLRSSELTLMSVR